MAWLAQLVERTTLNRVVVGSIPTLGGRFCLSDDSSLFGLCVLGRYVSYEEKQTTQGSVCIIPRE